MLNPIVHLLMYIGDAILTMLQNNFLTMAPILVEAESDQYKDFDGWAFTGIILAVIGMVVGICLAIPTGGVSLAGTIKCFAIGVNDLIFLNVIINRHIDKRYGIEGLELRKKCVESAPVVKRIEVCKTALAFFFCYCK